MSFIEIIDKKTDSSEEFEIKIPSDARVIWAVQRFFLWSILLTFFKIAVYSTLNVVYSSVKAIAIDSVLDLIVGGLGIYLIQWQRKVFEKVKNGTQKIEVNKLGTMWIAFLQGMILFIGGIVILVQSRSNMVEIMYYKEMGVLVVDNDITPIYGALILSIIISIKYYLYTSFKKEALITDNIAIKSLSSNLLIDLITAISSWVMLLATSISYYPWIIVDCVIGIFIGILTSIHGIKYIGPVLRYVSHQLDLEEKLQEDKDIKGVEENKQSVKENFKSKDNIEDEMNKKSLNNQKITEKITKKELIKKILERMSEEELMELISDDLK
jgi:divalent metal cation (Fe/Co/Zn/Cd) transporter